MSHVISTVLVAVLAVATIAGLSWLLRRAQPKALSGPRGMIRPERWSAWITRAVGTLMFALGVAAMFHSSLLLGALIAALGAAMAGFMAPSVTSVHAVNWDERGIEGPSTTFGPPLGLARTSIAWSEIAGMGKTSTSYWFVEAVDGRRIYWSYLYKGYGALTAALRHHCPSLKLPAGMA